MGSEQRANGATATGCLSNEMMQVTGTLVSLATCKVQEIVSSKGPGQSDYVITL